MKSYCVAALFALLASMSVCAEAPKAESADARFEALYKAEWAWRVEQFPGIDDEDGGAKVDDRLARVDAATQARQLAYWDEVLRKLGTIAPNDLSADNRVNYAVSKHQIETHAPEQLLS